MNRKYYNQHFIQEIDQISFQQIVREHKIRKQRKKQKQFSKSKFEQIKKSFPFVSEEQKSNIGEIIFSRPIRPARFVYHLSNPENRVSIARFGLQISSSFKKAVFANNQPLNRLNSFFPLCFCEGNPIELDIWEIDIVKAKVNWRVDPFMGDDNRYICTSEDIPPTAIRLLKAFVCKANTTNCGWLDLGSLHVEVFRFEEHAPTARLMNRMHYEEGGKLAKSL